MINKNDPLIAAVQKVMQSNQAERDAVKSVNEKFGVVDRKVLPRERQNEWDAAYKSVLSEAVDPSQYSEKQRKLAATAGDKEEIDGPDLHHVRKHGGKHIEEMTDEQKAKREKIVMSMKKKMSGFKDRYGDKAKDVMYATATKQSMKEDNEDFNNRHGLSENASDEKQAVAALNEDDIDSYENRMTAGLGQTYTPPGGGRFGGGAAKTGSLRPRPVRIDNPRIKNTRTGEQTIGASGPKTRTRIVRKQTSAAQQGTMQSQVAKMRQQSGDVAPVRVGMNPADRAKIRIDQAKRDVRRDPGSSVRQSNASAPNAAGALRRPPGQQSRPPVNTQGQGSMLPRPTNTSSVIRRGGAAAATALGAAGLSTSVGNQPPSSQASTLPKASMSGGGVNNPSGAKASTPSAGVAARKIEVPKREVSATEIVKDKDYQSNLSKVGGEKAARNLATGTKLDNLGTLEKGESIWSKTKEKLSRTAVPGFEAGNTKGGAGR